MGEGRAAVVLERTQLRIAADETEAAVREARAPLVAVRVAGDDRRAIPHIAVVIVCAVHATGRPARCRVLRDGDGIQGETCLVGVDGTAPPSPVGACRIAGQRRVGDCDRGIVVIDPQATTVVTNAVVGDGRADNVDPGVLLDGDASTVASRVAIDG